MSLLAKKEIIELISKEKLVFTPNLDKFQLQPHAIDLRLGYTFKIPHKWEMSEKGRTALRFDHQYKPKNNFDKITLKKGQYFELLPNEYVIATTLESMKIPNHLMAVLYPRSSFNRRGLALDLSGIIDAGYSGKLMIPLKNNTSSQIIIIRPGERICQITLNTLTSKIKENEVNKHGEYRAKYSSNNKTDFIKDPEDETKLIKTGDIKLLKDKYKLKK